MFPDPRARATQIFALFMGALATGVGGVSAQQVAMVDLDLASEHMWRGLSTTRFEMQFSASTWWVTEQGYVGAGVWGLGLPLGYKDSRPNRFNGATSAAVALENELDLWIEYGTAFESLTVAVGAVRYFFNDFRLTGADSLDLANTTELYGRVELSMGVPNFVFTPGLSLYYDVENVGGGYAEFSGTIRVPARVNTGLYVRGSLGFNLGQSWDPSALSGYFADTGLTLWDLSLSLPISHAVDYMTSGLSVHYRAPRNLYYPGTDPARVERGVSFSYSMSLRVMG